MRAWAVLAVVLFHFGVPGINGGFIGVDVFFVISGFLMTGIIVTGLEAGKFSLWQFYLARARRIVPALLVLCAVLMVLGWFWLPTVDYRQLGTHAFTAATFLSNIKFWREAGYFDAASHEKWLLHTWSLSAEWQFYLLLPVLLLLVWAIWRLKGVKAALMLGFLVSLAASVYATSRWPTASYYLLPTRAWEMLAGGLVWWLSVRLNWRPQWQRSTELTGIVLIITSAVWFTAADAWPGYNALVPVLGTMLVMLAQRQDSPFTANPLAQWMGLRSYSIYLWHWPVCVLLSYAGKLELPGWIALGVVASMLLGELSYRWVEEPVRKGSRGASPKRELVLLSGAVVLVAVAAIGVRYQKVEGRVPAELDLVAAEQGNSSPNRSRCHPARGVTSPGCVYGGSTVGAIVLGDSHADATVTAVQAALPNKELGVLGWTYSGCRTLRGAKLVDPKPNYHCDQFNEWALQQSDKVPAGLPLVIINRTTSAAFGDHLNDAKKGKPFVYFTERYTSTTPEFLAEFREHLVSTACDWAEKRPVFMVRPLPEMPVNVPKQMSRDIMFGRESKAISISLEEYHRRHAFVWEAQDEAAQRCGVKILNPLPYLCSDGRCWASKEGRPIYYDDDHLSEFGNKLLVPMFREVFEPRTAPLESVKAE
nr:acyltransferase family protein [Ferrimonas balearica]